MALIRHTGRIIPQELCGIICEYSDLSPRDLFSICQVSRAFYSEAFRKLYATPTLCGEVAIQTFCDTVLSRPIIGRGITTLTLYLMQQELLQVDEVDRIHSMLRCCEKLKNLSVHHEDPGMQDMGGRATMPWIIDHPFELKTFRSTYFASWVLRDILKLQPSIEELCLECGSEIEERGRQLWEWDFSLPKLKRLSCTYRLLKQLMMMPMALQTPLEQVHLVLVRTTEEEEDDALNTLSRFSGTLKGLSIVRYHDPEDVIQDITLWIARISSQLPDLKFLRFLDYYQTDEDDTPPIQLPETHFNSLETLILFPPRLEHSYTAKEGLRQHRRRPAHKAFQNTKGIEDQANDLLRSWPSLTRIAFITEVDFYEYTPDNIPEEQLPEQDPLEWPLMSYDVASYEAHWQSQWGSGSEMYAL